MRVCAKSLQSCPTCCDHMDCSPPGSSVHGILQARPLKWVTMLSSRKSSWSRDGIHILCLLHWQVGSLPLTPHEKPHIIPLTATYSVSNVQNRSSQDVLLWHVVSFELRTMETPWAHEKLPPPSFYYLEEFKIEDKHLMTQHLILLSCEGPCVLGSPGSRHSHIP